MRKRLTVSEVAKLLDVSAHTIRYYAKEGLITSSSDESGYRLFDFDDIYRLANVMMLRDSGIPVKEIKELVNNFSKDAYSKHLNVSLASIDQQIEKLNLQRKMIIENLESLSYENESFKTVDYPDRFLTVISTEDYDNRKTPKEYLSDLKEKDVSMILYKDLIYELRNDDMLVCYESKNSDVVLEAGSYLEYHIWITEESDYDEAIETFYDYIKNHHLHVENKLYLTLSPHALLVVDNGYQGKLFARIS